MSLKEVWENKAELPIPDEYQRQYRSFQSMVADADELSVFDKALVSFITLTGHMSSRKVPVPEAWNDAYAAARLARERLIAKMMR